MQEKHSIAITVAAAVTGLIFFVWLVVAFFFLKNQSGHVPVQQQQVKQAPTLQDVLPNQNSAADPSTGDTTYVDVDNIPAIYNPDSPGKQVPTSTTEDTTTQGSDSAPSVIE